MSRTTLHRTRILCLASALSLLPWHGAQALPRRAAPVTRTPTARLAAGLASLGEIWAALFTWELDNGCGMDPNGLCIPQAIPQTDNGCKMDPDGNPLPASCVAPQ